MAVFRLADRLVRRLAYFAFLAGAALLLVLGVIGFVDVLTLNLFFIPVPGLVEISGTLLAVIVFLGLAEAQARDANIAIDLFTQNMGPLMLRISKLFTLLIGAALMAVITWRTAHLALTAWQYHEVALGALAFPTMPGKVLAFSGAAIATAEYARQFLRLLFAPLDKLQVHHD